MCDWDCRAFLNQIRATDDEPANECVRKLRELGVTPADTARIFAQMDCNGAGIPEDTPDPLRDFLMETRWLPPGPPVDYEKVALGHTAFMTTLVPSSMVLLLRSIPQGYAAPALTEVLNISGYLRTQPYHRLIGTLQFLYAVSSKGAFDEPEGRGIVTTQQVRLLHAGVRKNVAPMWDGEAGGERKYEKYTGEFGEPINLEDMLGTMIAFSFLVVDGLRKLGIHMGATEGDEPPEEGKYTDKEEAYYYLWRLFARRFGIHPTGQPQSERYIPQNLTEAKQFFESYRQQCFKGATKYKGRWREESEEANPAGVALADAHVNMLGDVVTTIVPGFVRRWTPQALDQAIPRVYMRKLIGPEGCARIGVKRMRVSLLLSFMLTAFPILWAWLWGRVGSGKHTKFSELFLQGLIDSTLREDFCFFIPSDAADLEALVQKREEEKVEEEVEEAASGDESPMAMQAEMSVQSSAESIRASMQSVRQAKAHATAHWLQVHVDASRAERLAREEAPSSP